MRENDFYIFVPSDPLDL